MKTKQDMQSRLDQLKIKLDQAIKDRDDTIHNLLFILRMKDVNNISDQIRLLEWVLDVDKY